MSLNTNTLISLLLMILLVSSCAPREPTEGQIQTAIAQTQKAAPTVTLAIPQAVANTSTQPPIPTFTPTTVPAPIEEPSTLPSTGVDISVTSTPLPGILTPEYYSPADYGELNVLGDVLWEVNFTGRISRAPTIGPDGTVYVVTGQGTLYAMDPNGYSKWYQELGEVDTFSEYTSPTIAPDGRVMVVFDSKLLTFDPDGTPGWHWKTSEWLTSPPVFGVDGTSYIMTSHSNLYAISAKGAEMWSAELCGVYGGGIWPSPEVGPDGTVYATCHNDNVYAVDPNSGEVKWVYDTDPENSSYDRIEAAPMVGPDGMVYAAVGNGKIYSIRPDGQLLWTIELEPAGWINYRPFARTPDGTIYVVVASTLSAVSPSGETLWQTFIGSPLGDVGQIIATTEGNIFARTLANELVQISSDGNVISRIQLGESGEGVAPPPAVGIDGRMYIGVGDKLIAIQTDQAPVPRISIGDTTTIIVTTPMVVTSTATMETRAGVVPLPVVPTATPKPSGFTVIKFTSSLRVGDTASVIVEAYPGAACYLDYTTPSGTSSTAHGLGYQTANAKGRCSWSWLIGSRTTPGVGRVLIEVDDVSEWYPILIRK